MNNITPVEILDIPISEMNKFSTNTKGKKAIKQQKYLPKPPQTVDNFKRTKLECGHDTYHKKCIIDWARITPECPLCKH